MKKRLTSVLCLVLALLMLPALVACGDANGNDGKKTTEKTTDRVVNPGETEDPELHLYDDLPEGEFDGKEFKILNSNSDWGLVAMDAEGIGTPVDNAIFTRNRYLEENLDIEIQVTQLDYHGVKNTIANQVSGNLYEYDICYNEGWKHMELVQQGTFKSVRGYEQYLDFSKPWWYDDVMSDITLSDNLYLIAGDMNMMLNDSLWCMAFNKDTIARYDLESPYDLVEEGEWTYEALYEMTQKTLSDGKYGLVSHIAFASAMIVGADLTFTTRNEDGVVSRNILGERFTTVYQDMVEKFFTDNKMGGEYGIRTAYDSDNYKANNFPANEFNHHNIFTAGNSTFHAGTVGDMRVYMPSSEIEYGILPIPKYNKDQKQYISYVYRAGSMCGLPANIDSQSEGTLERVCTVMEWMCAYSYKVVRPVYYEVILYGRISRQPEAVEMLKVIFGLTDLGIKRIELDTIMNFGMNSTMELGASDASPNVAALINAKGKLVDSLITGLQTYYADNRPAF